MDIYLHNTMTDKKELFKPEKQGEVSMYHCGPTVYDFTHIGNLRSFVVADLIRRTFAYNGYTVHQVINITDVGHLTSDSDSGEDKMSKALKRENKPFTLEAMRDVGTFYAESFKADLSKLNILPPDSFPRATDHIKEDIEFVKILVDKGIGYKISDGIYFDLSKFPEYGKLGHIDLEGQKEGARVAVKSEKRNAGDFCLWKFDDKLGWDSPWGKGFPGWHIECSVMSRKYLGQPFDIHTGGIDLIPIHHNNEIAQSVAAYDKPLANYWMHIAFLDVNSAKMSKSAGTFIILKSLIDEGISPLAYRYWLLTSHYRSPVNFTTEAVKASQTALIRLISLLREYPSGGIVDNKYKDQFTKHINDDINTPKAIALIWDLLKDGEVSPALKKATLLDFDKVLGFGLDSIPQIEEESIPSEITALAEAREEARKSKDWEKADALRLEINSRGYSVQDTPGGIKIVRSD